MVARYCATSHWTSVLQYKVELYDNRVVGRHVDQMRSRSIPVGISEPTIPTEVVTQEWDVSQYDDTLMDQQNTQPLRSTATEHVGMSQSGALLDDSMSEPGLGVSESPRVKEKPALSQSCVLPSGDPVFPKTRSGRVVKIPVNL